MGSLTICQQKLTYNSYLTDTGCSLKDLQGAKCDRDEEIRASSVI